MENYQSGSMTENNSLAAEQVNPATQANFVGQMTPIEQMNLAGQANFVGQVNHVEQAQLADQALLVADVSFAWMQTSDDISGENYHYLNSGTCPDCHAAMVRLGSCFSCPCCGWSSCAV